MTRLLWTAEAVQDMVRIHTQLAEYTGLASAERHLVAFRRSADLAQAHPLIGKQGLVKNTRELYPINKKYRMVYVFDEDADTVSIITVLHGKQQYPENTGF
ncbi:type II toxin-antitoxin system RelE/ParE family toxin [Stenoxybacter acetivorans]|uniref:type II toxin-antitoxin system RelE/ParE family toxin n=1 Tax=Stenoxybacter acetivorans TaxID=422441 RepID=UPI000691C4FA|nr:type II toxin-antitoxin system RelE/ParE family toxin [Stenoxybacter acetivorans]